MSTLHIVYLILIFITVVVVSLIVLNQITPDTLQSRLRKLAQETPKPKDESAWIQRIVKLSGQIAKLSLPVEGWEKSQMRVRFMNAGYRHESAPILFFAAKTLLTFAFPALYLLYSAISGSSMQPDSLLLMLGILAAFGYFLPNIFLQRRIAYRKREIFENFPDAIDLITVCVEAGLGLDSALARVSKEMHLKSPVLGEELHLLNLELRAGNSRERALRNLALRTGVEEIDTLVVMLVQSDRFGTSVAESLRVHSDILRTKRRLRAEEEAAKIGTKLLFPLIFFIFPSMLLVLLGPAYISIQRILLPTMGAQ